MGFGSTTLSCSGGSRLEDDDPADVAIRLRCKTAEKLCESRWNAG
jgi:hypothetical protein